MNIAFLTTEYITETEFDGGLANYLYRTAKSLSDRGHNVEIFTLSACDGETLHDGIRVHQVANHSAFFSFLNRATRYRIKRMLRFLSLSYCLDRRLKKRMGSHAFDIIQTSNCFGCGLFSAIGCKVPVVTRVSSFEPLFRLHYRRPLTMDQRLCERIELCAIKKGDAVYAPSLFLAALLREQKQIAADVLRPLFTLHPGTEDEAAYQKYVTGKKYFLFFGSIGFLKGCETIANALPCLLAKYPDMHFVFSGKVMEGPGNMDMGQYISKQAGSNAQRLIFTGSLRHQELYPIIRHAHAVVLPSLVDNLPNAMLEAMALSKVVIGTHGTSFEEFIENNVSGILIEPNNVNSLKDAMEKTWLMDVDEQITIGNKARMKTEELSPSIICEQLEKYFQSIISMEI